MDPLLAAELEALLGSQDEGSGSEAAEISSTHNEQPSQTGCVLSTAL